MSILNTKLKKFAGSTKNGIPVVTRNQRDPVDRRWQKRDLGSRKHLFAAERDDVRKANREMEQLCIFKSNG